MRYILYARKSSESEDRQVQSIEDQRRILRSLAHERHWNIAEEIEESRSAKDPGVRPGFDRMLQQIERGQADAILCWSVNRLSRNPIDSGKLSWLLQRGVLQVIQTPEKPYLPSDNVLIFSVETGMANQYILDLKKAVRRGTDSKLAKGWSPHRAPEGYRNDLRDHTIEPDPERFALLLRAWRLLIAGTHTPARVIEMLNDQWGYRTRETAKGGGKKLSRSAGYRLFSSIFYAGYFKHGDQVYKGAHPAMVTLAEYETVQERLTGQAGKAHRHTHDFAYAGLMRCGRCGGGITAETQSGRHGRGCWTYYHCGNASRTCDKRSVREDVLEERINTCLAQVTITAEFQEIVRDLLEKWIVKEFGSQEARYGQQLRALADGERMLSELLEMRLRRLITDEQYEAKQRELSKTVSSLRLEVGHSQERLDRTRAVVSNALDFRLCAQAQFLIGGVSKRREIARSLGVRYVLDAGEVFIEMHPLLVPWQGLAAEDMRPVEEIRPIEPLESGFESAKRTDICASVPVGWADGTENSDSLHPCGTWVQAFQLVWDNAAFFAASTTGSW